MFIKTKVTEFNLDLVPEIFKRGWEMEHGGPNQSLKRLQNSCRATIRRLEVFFIQTICVCFFAWIIISSTGGSKAFSPVWLATCLSLLALAPMAFCVFVYRFMPPFHISFMKDFINEYEALMHLMNQEWKYGFEYPTGGPGVLPTYENAVPFVREKLIKLAQQIKALDDPKGDWGDCLGGAPDPKELRKEFGRKFDILAPFGLVYPGYEPYFDPEYTYFYA